MELTFSGGSEDVDLISIIFCFSTH